MKIEGGRYWELPWSLVDGCTPCSPGCDHCWSAAMTHRFENNRVEAHHCKNGPVFLTYSNGKFTGQIITHPDRLDIPCGKRPYRLRKPRVYAIWNDLFHEAVPEEFIRKVYRVMVAEGNTHTYLVLTKRPWRMADFLFDETVPNNIYHGLTICNQPEADSKIPEFLQVPGKKFLSIEPMLGAMDIHYIATPQPGWLREYPIKNIDAVILGGETGAGARAMHPGWVRSVRDQCQAAGVDFFFKGWGTQKCSCYLNVKAARRVSKGLTAGYECPIHDWEQEKGRLLDGRTHDNLPWRIA